MKHTDNTTGPVSITSGAHDIADEALKSAAETIANTPPGPTLIDTLSDADFLAPSDGDITVGKLKKY